MTRGEKVGFVYGLRNNVHVMKQKIDNIMAPEGNFCAPFDLLSTSPLMLQTSATPDSLWT